MGSEAGRSSTAWGRELGVELRRIRESAGISGTELARLLGWSPAKQSRLESGTRATSEVDVAMYLACCRVPRDDIDRLLDLSRERDDGYLLRPHGEQLLQLLFASSRSQCSVRVVPFSIGPCGAFAGSFRVMQYAEHPPVVYVQTETASLFLEAEGDVLTHRKILARLDEVALDGGQSREWLARLASEYEQLEDYRDDDASTR